MPFASLNLKFGLAAINGAVVESITMALAVSSKLLYVTDHLYCGLVPVLNNELLLILEFTPSIVVQTSSVLSIVNIAFGLGYTTKLPTLLLSLQLLIVSEITSLIV